MGVYTEGRLAGDASGMRTPYFEAVARLLCFHEAGHVVVGHALGWQLTRVRAGREIDRAEFVPVAIPSLYHAETKKELAKLTAELRRAMTVVAAGPVAGTIHQEELQERGFASSQESR